MRIHPDKTLGEKKIFYVILSGRSSIYLQGSGHQQLQLLTNSDFISLNTYLKGFSETIHPAE